MATQTPLRSLAALSRRPAICRSCARTLTSLTSSVNSSKNFSTTTAVKEETLQERPRWSYTPEQMKAPFHPRVKDPAKAWTCNEDPKVLDAMYVKLLGPGGDKVLDEEVKWLAVTHKSFDQGRRGFNDRLAFFGKRIVTLQSNLAVLHSPNPPARASEDPYNREPFEHPALEGLPNLATMNISEILDKERVANLARSYGIGDVTRWKPKNPANLAGSGIDVVHSTSLYALIGAISLQKGGEFANQVVKDKILRPLGFL